MVLTILRGGGWEVPQGKVPPGHAGTLLTMVDVLFLFFFSWTYEATELKAKCVVQVLLELSFSLALVQREVLLWWPQC